jgi:hypothetical protein
MWPEAAIPKETRLCFSDSRHVPRFIHASAAVCPVLKRDLG